jgi:hypothetical protein
MEREHDDDAAEDPFEGMTFDEAFIRDASHREESAEERIERWQRIDAEHRRIIESARAQVRAQVASTHRPALASSPPPRRRRRPWALLVVAALIVALFWVRSHEGGDTTTASGPSVGGASVNPFDHTPAGGVVRIEGGQPPPAQDAQDTPIGQPPLLPASTGPYTFVATQSNASVPVAYDPCRPIHIVINGRTAPRDGETLFREALGRVSQATGLQFVIDGPTAEAPKRDRVPYQPDRYPDQWAPVLVAWSDPEESNDLGGDIAGKGGSSWLELPRGSVYVSGVVVLDGPDLAELLSQPGGRDVARAIVQHELGHLVGLDHVQDPTQLMYPETGGDLTDYAAGDRRGLAALGQGACFPEI